MVVSFREKLVGDFDSISQIYLQILGEETMYWYGYFEILVAINTLKVYCKNDIILMYLKKRILKSIFEKKLFIHMILLSN